ncbi:MAG TPA: OmpW family outer membrane protein [Thermoanaerobaculia bacterium]|nr:OmpW family outer membrane protein [Thermoanaerobaculia bacterium]
MKSAVVIAVALLALPLFAQRRVDIFLDAEAVKRTGRISRFSPGTTRFEPSFRNGGGVGGGVNLFVSDRLSFEAKVAALGTKSRIRVVGSDFIATADLGWAQIYPISATMQWHLLERPAVRPYIGVGVVHTILKNINKRIGPTATGVRYKDPTGLVLDGGLEFNLGRRWNLLADVRYVPIETTSRATFSGAASSVDLHVRPAIVSFGLGYRF